PRVVSSWSDPPLSQSNLYTRPNSTGSTPLTVSTPPLLILASVNWIPVETFTPGTCAALSTASAGIGEKLSDWMIRSLVSERPSAPRNDSFNPFTNTAANTTRATPIISAAAVTAVRPGLRRVFSSASRPDVVDAGSHGQSRGRRRHSQ